MQTFGMYIAVCLAGRKRERERTTHENQNPPRLVCELHDLYSAETQLVDALPKMAKAATNVQLNKAFTAHLTQTKGHVQRLSRFSHNSARIRKAPPAKA